MGVALSFSKTGEVHGASCKHRAEREWWQFYLLGDLASVCICPRETSFNHLTQALIHGFPHRSVAEGECPR